MAFDDRRLPIPRPSDDDPHRREQHDETALYDVSAGQERWKLPGAGSGATVVGGRVCMLLDDEPTPVDLGSGEIVWQTRAGCP